MRSNKAVNIKAAYEALLPLLPNEEWRLMPDQASDRQWYSLRLATPYTYPDGEQIYLYVEVFNVKERLIRLHDDEVLTDWLSFHELYHSFKKIKADLEETLLKPLGFNFTRNNVAPQVSAIVPLEQTMEAAVSVCEVLVEIAKASREAKYAKRKDNILERLIQSIKGGNQLALATA